MKLLNKHSGFSFIEVLIAIVILSFASLYAVDIVRGSVRATRDAKEMTIATMLLQKTMSELETKLETEKIEKGCEKKTTGKFDPPFEKYNWTTFCNEIDFKLSQTASKLLDDKDKETDTDKSKEDMVSQLVLQAASDYISKSVRELHAEIEWTQGKLKRKVDATTHYAEYDKDLVPPTL